MPWVKLDDKFPDHEKIEPLSDGAFRLHVSAMCHSARYLTDGRIRAARVSRLMDGYKPRYLHELLTAGVWEQNGSGYLIHDFTDYNKDREWWEARRAKGAARIGEWRRRRDEEHNE